MSRPLERPVAPGNDFENWAPSKNRDTGLWAVFDCDKSTGRRLVCPFHVGFDLGTFIFDFSLLDVRFTLSWVGSIKAVRGALCLHAVHRSACGLKSALFLLGPPLHAG